MKKFWNEWGFSKEDLGIIVGGISVVVTIAAMYIIMCSIG